MKRLIRNNLLCLVGLLLLSNVVLAQSAITHSTKRPTQTGRTAPTIKNRTISDLVNYPFGFVNSYSMSQEKMAQLVDEQFGGHQIVKTGFMRVPCIVVTSSDGYDYKYKNHPICMAICEHVKNDPDVYGYWYVFKFDSKTEAKSFAKKMVADIATLGIQLKVQLGEDEYDAVRYNLKKFEHIGVSAQTNAHFPENVELPQYAVLLEICDPGRKNW